MNVLVIGAKGFIGGHVCAYLNGLQGYRVHSCDVVVDYTTPRYYQIDATTSDFTDLFSRQPFDWCVNCSGASSVPDSLTNPHRDYLLNTYNVFKLLDAIRRHNAGCKFINLSSAAVYGNPAQLPVRETSAVQPISPYGVHKQMAENLCREFYNFFGVRSCSLRIFSAYGEGLKKQILWDVLSKMKAGPAIELFGDGFESRDFIHARDIALVVDRVAREAPFEGEVINVANGDEIPIRDVVGLLARARGWAGTVSYSGVRRAGDPTHWQADISLLRSFGYRPSVSLEAGINQYVRWASENT